MKIEQEAHGMTTVTTGAYAQPTLQRLGAIEQLTAAGSGVDIENGNPGNCSQNTNARPCR